MKELATAIRFQRKALGLTQSALAQFAGCSTVFVVQVEAGKPTLQLHKLLAVLNVLGLQLRLERGKKGLVADKGLAQ